VEGAVGGDEFESRNGGGEIAVVAAGAVGSGGAGSDDRDVWKGSEVVNGEAAGVDVGGEQAVGDTGTDGYGAGFGVEFNGVELLEGDLIGGAVGYAVERMATAEGAEFGAGGDDVLDFGGGFGLVEVLGVEGVVASPVCARGCGLSCLFSGDEAREHGSGKDRAGAFEKLSFVHGALSFLLN